MFREQPPLQMPHDSSPHYAKIFYCGTETIRRAAPTALPLARAPRRAVQHACGALGRAPGQDGVFDASLHKPMHNPG